MNSSKKLLLFILLSGVISIKAQKNTTIDSLKKVYLNCSSDTERVEILVYLSSQYSHTNIDSARNYALRALNIANKTKSNKTLAFAHFSIGVNYMNTGDYRKTMNHQFTAMKYAELCQNKNLLMRINNSIANCYASQNKYDMALPYFEKAVSMAKESDNRILAILLMNIGNVYYSKGYYTNNFKKAYDYYFESLKYARKNKNADEICGTLSNLALTYCDDKKYKEGLKCLDEALHITDSVGLEENKIFIYYTIARINDGMKKYDEALEFYEKSLKLSILMGDKNYISDNYQSIAEVNAEKGNYKLSYEYYKKHKIIEDSIVNLESLNQLNELQTKYETAKKQKENELLQTQNKLSTHKIQQQKIISYFIIAALILALGLAYFIFRGLKNQRLANKIISQQKEEVERQKLLVEEHQKEILDSIHYAKRIQQSLLPTKKYLEKTFKRLNE